MTEARDHEARAEEIARGLTKRMATVLLRAVELRCAEWPELVAGLHMPGHVTVAALMKRRLLAIPEPIRDELGRCTNYAQRIPTPLGLAVANHLKGKTDE